MRLHEKASLGATASRCLKKRAFIKDKPLSRSWRLQVHISEEGQVWMYSRTGEDWVTRERSVNHSAMAPLLRKEVGVLARTVLCECSRCCAGARGGSGCSCSGHGSAVSMCYAPD